VGVHYYAFRLHSHAMAMACTPLKFSIEILNFIVLQIEFQGIRCLEKVFVHIAPALSLILHEGNVCERTNRIYIFERHSLAHSLNFSIKIGM
jgi:hypothetical protein